MVSEHGALSVSRRAVKVGSLFRVRTRDDGEISRYTKGWNYVYRCLECGDLYVLDTFVPASSSSTVARDLDREDSGEVMFRSPDRSDLAEEFDEHVGLPRGLRKRAAGPGLDVDEIEDRDTVHYPAGFDP